MLAILYILPLTTDTIVYSFSLQELIYNPTQLLSALCWFYTNITVFELILYILVISLWKLLNRRLWFQTWTKSNVCIGSVVWCSAVSSNVSTTDRFYYFVRLSNSQRHLDQITGMRTRNMIIRENIWFIFYFCTIYLWIYFVLKAYSLESFVKYYIINLILFENSKFTTTYHK